MSWVNTYDSLYDAIISSTGSNINKNIVRAEINNAWNKGGIKGVEALAESYGVEAHGRVINSAGQQFINWWSVGETTPVGTFPPSVYQEALEVNTVASTEDTIVLRSLPKVADKSIGSGAVQTFVKWAPLVGAVATGVGLGVKSYKDYPVMWSDISDAIFSANFNDLVKIMCREYNGEYKTYIKEDDVADIISALAFKDAFDIDTITSNIPVDTPEGIMDTNFSVVGAPDSPSGIFAYNYYLENFSDYDIIMNADRKISDSENVTFLYLAKHEDLPTNGYIKKDFNGTYYIELYNLRFISARVNTITGQLLERYTDVRNSSIISGYVEGNNDKTAGGLNVTVMHKKGNNPLFFIPETGNTLKNITPDMSILDIKNKLKNTYPDWFNNGFTSNEYDPTTDTIVENNYIPLTLPTQNPLTHDLDNPEYNQEKAQEGKPDPKNETQTQPLIQNEPNIPPVSPPTPTPSDNGGGLVGSGSNNGLWSIYNPTINELKSLGGYLWSSNIIEILQKFLNNPMDCIISLHMIYATPSTNDKQNIILGYLDSGVSANVVVNQFINIDCGSVNTVEYFGDARDYVSPYTDVECYLPFIGIVKLKTEDIISSNINIIYTLDVLTGAILCKIFVTKNGAKQQLYTFNGNASVQIPLTGSDRTRLLSGAITGAVAGITAGGLIGAVAGGVAGGLMGGTSIERSGNFSANSGALGIKKPYLIISRKTPYDADNYNDYYGYPSNKTVVLNSCKGFTRVKDIHVNIPNATNEEKNEIETLLKNGIII